MALKLMRNTNALRNQEASQSCSILTSGTSWSFLELERGKEFLRG